MTSTIQEKKNQKCFELIVTPSNIGVATFDTPNSSVNLLSTQAMTELNTLIDQVNENKLKGLIIISGKRNNFIAGADVKEIQAIQKEGVIKAYEAATLGKTVFAKLEMLPMPTVAAISGTVLGGGAELALACRYRVATRNSKIGLPEVNLGLLPGWGGCVRLAKKIGMAKAIEFISAGKTLDALKAWKLRVIDELLEKDASTEALTSAAQQIVLEGRPKRAELSLETSLARFFIEGNPIGRSLFCMLAKKQILKQTKGKYPAPLEILKVIRKVFELPAKNAYELESQAFANLVTSEVAANLIGIFFAQQDSKKMETDGSNGEATAASPKIIGVLGSGIMGSGIAQAAAYAGFHVLLYDINDEVLEQGVKRIANLFDGLVDRGKLSAPEANRMVENIATTTELAELRDSDLVIEAIVEDPAIKKKTLTELSKHLKKECIFASNTSSLSISAMSEALDQPENMVGIHFFNPVHRMPLVEVVKADKTSVLTMNTAKKFAQKLGKTTVVASDAPGFIVNRILGPYLREAVVLLEQGMEAEDIDKAIKSFGMPMGPITLLDEIGLDVAGKVMESMSHAFGERQGPLKLFKIIQEQKLLGKKGQKGFFLYDEKGKRLGLNPDITQAIQAEPIKKTAGEIQDRLILLMVNEAAMCLEEEIATSPAQLDLAMIFGTGFPPYRGGLLRYADKLSTPLVVEKMDWIATAQGQRYKPCKLLMQLAQDRKSFY
jgi:3-hydroxyacyl-CoA dehydrogenase / enoyl-CoA hydratase / 3-hydroxybutyryl-CoA epimerase